MTTSSSPIDALPAWALLTGIDLVNVHVENVEGRGYGLVASKDISDHALRIPRDLVLTAEAIEDCAKANQNLRQLLDAVGRRSARNDIKLYLLVQIAMSKHSQPLPRGCPLTPWTEYVKFLPRHAPLPTMWSEDERELLRGTSLEATLEAKLSALVGEFQTVREKSLGLPFWSALFWGDEAVFLHDWALADALYRSRSLELPQSAQEAMVPVLDMANHAHDPTACYDEDVNGNVVLSMRQGCAVQAGQEVTISYGSEKSAAEMLFSYGFIDEHAAHDLTLPLAALPGDPVGQEKLHMLREPATLRIWQQGDSYKWHSPATYLLCLNHEDGLDFRLLQDVSGGRELRLFWQDEDVTDKSGNFERLIEDHALCQVFKLRVIVTLLERVTTQLDRIASVTRYSREQVERGDLSSRFDRLDDGNRSAECIQAAEALRKAETSVLKGIAGVFEEEKANLLTSEPVLAYLEMMDNTEDDGVEPDHDGRARQDVSAPTEGEDDFS